MRLFAPYAMAMNSSKSSRRMPMPRTCFLRFSSFFRSVFFFIRLVPPQFLYIRERGYGQNDRTRVRVM